MPFPPVKERFERLEEALHICRAMFRGERPTIEGKHYSVKDAINSPAPVTPGGPPIMIGGQGEKKTLRLMAEHAEMANLTSGFDELPRKLEVLAGHCADVGRDIGTHQQDRALHRGGRAHDGGGRGACATGSSAPVASTGTPSTTPPASWSAPAWWSAMPTPPASGSSELVGPGPRRPHVQHAGQRSRPRRGRPHRRRDQGSHRLTGAAQAHWSRRAAEAEPEAVQHRRGFRSRTRRWWLALSRRRLDEGFRDGACPSASRRADRGSPPAAGRTRHPSSARHCERPDSWRMKPRMNVTKRVA